MKTILYITTFFLFFNINEVFSSSINTLEEEIVETSHFSSGKRKKEVKKIEEKEEKLLQVVSIDLDGPLELNTPGAINCYNCCQWTWNYYRIISGYTLEFLALHCNTIGTLGGFTLTVCAGINKYSDPNSSIHESLSTTSLAIGTVVTASSLIGAWAKKEGDRRLAVTKKTLKQHQEKVEKLKGKVKNLKKTNDRPYHSDN